VLYALTGVCPKLFATSLVFRFGIKLRLSSVVPCLRAGQKCKRL